MNSFNSTFDGINSIIKQNPLLATIGGMYGLAVATYLLRDLPKAFFAWIKKQFTTTLSISNSQACYYRIMELFQDGKTSDKVRAMKFLNGRWGGSSKIIKSIGPGIHMIWFRKNPIWISVAVKDTASSDEKLTMEITKLGRSHKLFDILKEELSVPEDAPMGKTCVYRWKKEYWEEVTKYPSRSMDTIFIPETQKTQLLASIRKFLSSEDEYLKKGIPYQYGIMLEGPSGTGKTSLISALAGVFNKKICILPSTELYFLVSAISCLPDDSFLVVEDVDSDPTIHARGDAPKESSKGEKKKESAENEEDDFQKKAHFYLSEILNGLDGLIRSHGRILIMTTNHIEKLDSAFLRGGRVDLTMHIGEATLETFCNFLKVYFGRTDGMTSNMEIIPVTMATLQTDYFNGVTYEEFLEKYTCKEKATI